MKNKHMLFDYLDILFEAQTMQMELDSLSDDALLDECNHILAGIYENDDIEEVLYEYFKNGNITKEQRKKAEQLYTLAYSEFLWEV